MEAPRSEKADVPAKAKASGVALHLSYDLKPFKLSGRIEYVKDNSDAGGIDLVGLGDGNKGRQRIYSERKEGSNTRRCGSWVYILRYGHKGCPFGHRWGADHKG